MSLNQEDIRKFHEFFFLCKCKVLCGERDNATKFVPVYGYYVGVVVVVIG
jgi:hypothetical protein